MKKRFEIEYNEKCVAVTANIIYKLLDETSHFVDSVKNVTELMDTLTKELTEECECKNPDVITARQDEHKEYCKECGKEVKEIEEIEELEEGLENYPPAIWHRLNKLIRLLKKKKIIADGTQGMRRGE